MKKMKKVLALLLGSVMAVGAIGSVNAEARSIFIDDALEAPDGYEQFDDEGKLSFVDNVANVDDYVYTAYRKSCENEEQFYVYHSYKYNYTVLNVVNEKIETYDEIYNKYSALLDMDYHYRSNPPLTQPDYDVTATLYDRYDENGEETKDPSAMEDKFELIQEMCAEMYEAGCITEANYMGMTANASFGWYSGLYVDLNTDDEKSEYDKLNEIAGGFTDGKIKSYSEDGGVYYLDVDLLEADDLNSAIQEVYPDAAAHTLLMFQGTTDTVSTESVNLLSALLYEVTDVNTDGKTDITDAALILQHYAQRAAYSVSSASETNAMDVNGDGSIDIADATKVLEIYAQRAAGVTAS